MVTTGVSYFNNDTATTTKSDTSSLSYNYVPLTSIQSSVVPTTYTTATPISTYVESSDAVSSTLDAQASTLSASGITNLSTTASGISTYEDLTPVVSYTDSDLNKVSSVTSLASSTSASYSNNATSSAASLQIANGASAVNGFPTLEYYNFAIMLVAGLLSCTLLATAVWFGRDFELQVWYPLFVVSKQAGLRQV